MIFEGSNMRVIVPLDPSEGVRYTKAVKEEHCATNIDNFYRMIAQEHDFVNPTTKCKLTWKHDSSFTSDSEEELENW